MNESTFTWATVTAVGPLRIKLDGDSAQLPFAPESLIDPLSLNTADRVRCEISNSRVLLLGVGGGVVIADVAPVGVVQWFAGGSVPSSAWLVCDGSAVSRSTYAALFALIGTTYGAGNGSTTFNLPDLRERAAMGANTATSIGTATFTNATDLVNRSAHGLVDGDRVYFTGGTMPTGLTASTRYFVVNSAANTFQLATTVGGTPINFTTDGSGTRTLFVENFPVGLSGGEKSHTLTTAEIPAHTHGLRRGTGYAVGGAAAADDQSYAPNTLDQVTQSTGGGRPHNSLPPYVALTPIIKALAAA